MIPVTRRESACLNWRDPETVETIPPAEAVTRRESACLNWRRPAWQENPEVPTGYQARKRLSELAR